VPKDFVTVEGVTSKFGANLGQKLGLLGPNLGFSGGKGNRLNWTFGRGGGDRNQFPTRQVIPKTAIIDQVKWSGGTQHLLEGKELRILKRWQQSILQVPYMLSVIVTEQMLCSPPARTFETALDVLSV
jgi:hypothetical protein